VELGPLPLAEFVAMQRDERWRAKADALLAMAAPASSQAEWRLVLREDDRGARLGDRQRGRLGSTTWLAA
jgi:predicted component of type VI protein secretion system